MTTTVKIENADRSLGQTVNLAIAERIYDDHGQPLGDGIIGEVNCVIVGVGTHWSDTVHGRSGRYYRVEPLERLPVARVGRSIVLMGE